jgi:predicted ArsR family transcriptional regulator
MDLENEAFPAENRLLSLIKRRGPQRTSDIATALGVSVEGIRQQLARLERLGLVTRSAAPGAVGRPALEWSLTASAHARFPDTHADLTISLLQSVRAELGEGAIDRLIGRRDAEARDGYSAALRGARTIDERVSRLAALRTREGYMAEAQRDSQGWLFVENHCPICAAATACQGFCRSELDVFRAVLGDDVEVERTEHLLTGARRCAYRITPKETNDDAMARRVSGGGSRAKAIRSRAD